MKLMSRPLQPGPEPPIEGESRPRDLRPAGEIEDVQGFADLPVRTWRKAKYGLFSVDADDGVVLGTFPEDDRGVRDVGERHQDRLNLLVRLLERLVECP